jgi:hypothetical protein
MDNKFIYVYLSRVYSYEMHTAVSERQIVKFDKVRNCFISAQKLNNDDSDLYCFQDNKIVHDGSITVQYFQSWKE